MERVTDAAEAIVSTAESLLAVLEEARMTQSPAVPPTQLRVLAIVAVNRHTNMNGLAVALGVVPSSASRLCDRLEAIGLLVRLTDPHDRREVRLALTPAARRLLDELRDRRRAAVAEVLGRMAPAAREELVSGLAAFDRAAASAEDPATADPRAADPRLIDPQAVNPRVAHPSAACPPAATPRAGDQRSA